MPVRSVSRLRWRLAEQQQLIEPWRQATLWYWRFEAQGVGQLRAVTPPTLRSRGTRHRLALPDGLGLGQAVSRTTAGLRWRVTPSRFGPDQLHLSGPRALRVVHGAWRATGALSYELCVASRGQGAPLRVTLDPGHGGANTGTLYDGLEEADLVLDLAQRVRRRFSQVLPELDVDLTRDRDHFVELDMRALQANAKNSRLFLSLHLNASSHPIKHGGVTTYHLGEPRAHHYRRRAALDDVHDYARLSPMSRDLLRIDTARYAEASATFARHLHQAVLAAGRRHLPALADRGVRPAPFAVLVHAKAPAILLEASFLSSPGEGEALKTEPYREALAQGMVQGIWQSLRAQLPAPPKEKTRALLARCGLWYSGAAPQKVKVKSRPRRPALALVSAAEGATSGSPAPGASSR